MFISYIQILEQQLSRKYSTYEQKGRLNVASVLLIFKVNISYFN